MPRLPPGRIQCCRCSLRAQGKVQSNRLARATQPRPHPISSQAADNVPQPAPTPHCKETLQVTLQAFHPHSTKGPLGNELWGRLVLTAGGFAGHCCATSHCAPRALGKFSQTRLLKAPRVLTGQPEQALLTFKVSGLSQATERPNFLEFPSTAPSASLADGLAVSRSHGLRAVHAEACLRLDRTNWEEASQALSPWE